MLENEFGTSVDEDVIKVILEKGTTQTTEVSTYHHTSLMIAINDMCTSSLSVKAQRTTPRAPWSLTRSVLPINLLHAPDGALPSVVTIGGLIRGECCGLCRRGVVVSAI